MTLPTTYDKKYQPKVTMSFRGRKPVGISWWIAEFAAPYQEIAPQAFPSVTTACGLAMTAVFLAVRSDFTWH